MLRTSALSSCWRAVNHCRPAWILLTASSIMSVRLIRCVMRSLVQLAQPLRHVWISSPKLMLAQIGMIGKAERGKDGIGAIRNHGAVYLIAIGGAAYLVSKAIRSAKVIAFADLGMEAIYEFEVENMPVTVTVDAKGRSVHDIGPADGRMAQAYWYDSGALGVIEQQK